MCVKMVWLGRGVIATLIAGVLLGAGACASSGLTQGNAFGETYANDRKQVRRAVAEAVRVSNLGMTEMQTLENGALTTEVYQMQSMSDTGDEVRTATLQLTLEREKPQRTRLEIETSASSGGGGSYGTSRGESEDTPREVAERLLQRLEDRLSPVQ